MRVASIKIGCDCIKLVAIRVVSDTQVRRPQTANYAYRQVWVERYRRTESTTRVRFRDCDNGLRRPAEDLEARIAYRDHHWTTEIETCVRDVEFLIEGLPRNRLRRKAVGTTQYPQALRGGFVSVAPNSEIRKPGFQCRNSYFVDETRRTNLPRVQNVTAQGERRIGRDS